VVLGEANDKNIVIREGLKPGSQIYLVTPENPEKFKLDGDELIASIKEN
jgi:hypothetical protein